MQPRRCACNATNKLFSLSGCASALRGVRILGRDSLRALLLDDARDSLLVALLMLFAVTAIALRIAPRLAWPATGLLLVLLGALCAEIAPAVNQQKQLALLVDAVRLAPWKVRLCEPGRCGR